MATTTRMTHRFLLWMSLVVLLGCQPARWQDHGFRCHAPRPSDPATGYPYYEVRGTLDDDKEIIRGIMAYHYLWSEDVPQDVDPSLFTETSHGTPEDALVAYFDALTSSRLRPDGQPKDFCSHAYKVPEPAPANASTVDALYPSYGVTLSPVTHGGVRRFRAVDVLPGSPAEEQGLLRGALVTHVNNRPTADAANDAALWKDLWPASAGQQLSLVLADGGTVTLVSRGMSAASPVRVSRILDTPDGPVGYLFPVSFDESAEPLLLESVLAFRTAGVVDVILDLRVDGGGCVAVASALSAMLAGPQRTGGRMFSRMKANPMHLNEDDPALSIPFQHHAVFTHPTLSAGTPLPALNLSRVLVLAGPDTAGNGEFIINGLRGAGVDVVVFGARSYGNPNAGYPFEVCSMAYVPVAYELLNDQRQGFGFSGIPPNCPVEDTFNAALGQEQESLLAAALAWRQQGVCAPVSKVPNAGNPGAADALLDSWRGPVHKGWNRPMARLRSRSLP